MKVGDEVLNAQVVSCQGQGDHTGEMSWEQVLNKVVDCGIIRMTKRLKRGVNKTTKDTWIGEEEYHRE